MSLRAMHCTCACALTVASTMIVLLDRSTRRLWVCFWCCIFFRSVFHALLLSICVYSLSHLATIYQMRNMMKNWRFYFINARVSSHYESSSNPSPSAVSIRTVLPKGLALELSDIEARGVGMRAKSLVTLVMVLVRASTNANASPSVDILHTFSSYRNRSMGTPTCNIKRTLCFPCRLVRMTGGEW